MLADHRSEREIVGVLGGICAVLVLGFAAVLYRGKITDLVVFFTLVALVPVLCATLVQPSWRQRAAALAGQDRFRKIAPLLTIPVAKVVLGGVLASAVAFAVSGIALGALAVLLLAALLVSIVRWQTPRTIPDDGANWFLFAALIVGMVFFSPLDRALIWQSTAIDYVVNVDNFHLWIIGGCVYVLAAIAIGRWEARQSGGEPWLIASRFAALGALMMLAAGLYDDGHYAEFTHYIPYVGPALYANAGGVPFVDVYCQYGFIPWTLIYAAYQFFPTGYGAAAIVVRLVHVLYLAVIVLVAYSAVRRRISAMLLMVPVLLVSISYHIMFVNLNAFPSAGGMRYLPPALMALVMINHNWAARPPRAAVAVLILASFWSLESFLFSGAIWGVSLALEAWRTRAWRDGVIAVATGIGAVVAAHLVFAVAVKVSTGHWIDYRPYLEMFGIYMDVRPIWMSPVNGNFLWWVPVWLLVFVTLALAISTAMRGGERTDASRRVPLAMWTIGASAYFAGRSNSTTLWMAAIPFSILLICNFEIIQERAQRGMTLIVSTSTAAIFALMFAFGGEKFTQPVDITTGNSTILRHCFSDETCWPSAIAARVHQALYVPPTDIDWIFPQPAVDSDGRVSAKLADLKTLLRDRFADAKRVKVLPDFPYYPFVGIFIFSQTGQWYDWPFSTPANDLLSDTLSRKILDAAVLTEGELLVVGKPETGLFPFEREMLARVKASCSLVPVADTRFHTVYRGADCRPTTAASRR